MPIIIRTFHSADEIFDQLVNGIDVSSLIISLYFSLNTAQDTINFITAITTYREVAKSIAQGDYKDEVQGLRQARLVDCKLIIMGLLRKIEGSAENTQQLEA